MSSSKDLFGPEDFENLIAAVDSLDIPSIDESSTASTLNSYSEKASSTHPNTTQSSKATFAVDGDPFGNEPNTMHVQASGNDEEFNEFGDLSDDYYELDFDELENSTNAFSPTASFDAPSNSGSKNNTAAGSAKAAAPKAASFAVDDPFASSTTTSETAFNDEEDELIDVYASFLEASDEDPQPANSMNAFTAKTNIVDDDFSEFADLSSAQKTPSQKLDYFGDDGFEVFDGVAAANEISALWDENSVNEQNQAKSVSPKQPLHMTKIEDKPLHSTMAKTKQAADKLKAHLESLSTNAHAVAATVEKTKPVQLEAPADGVINNDLDNEFAELASQASLESHAELTKEQPVEEPAKPAVQAMSEAISEKIKETVTLNRKTEVISDNMLAAFVDSPLNSKHKVRFFSLQNFAIKLPRTYFVCTALLSLVGFAYILAIPALLAVTMFNGFEMLNSPFTNNMLMLLTALFSISLFLFMTGYKLMDLKFVGPGGITLNHENADALISKIKQLQQQRAIPKVHEVILTRRHELNLIKIPRFGIPIWSKNVLAIGYPLLQTLPADFFDVALSRRLAQFSKRKNLMHNWLSFMRRTWTIYAVSLKERKGVIDLLHYCFFAPYACLYRSFAVYISQKDELMADEKALHHCNDRDLMKTAQTLRITRAMLVQYFWPKLNEDLQSNTAAPHYVQPYSKLPETLNTLLRSKNVDAWFIRLGQEETNPGDSEAPFAMRMNALAQRKVAIPDAFDTSAAQHYFADQYEKMTDLMNTLWAEEVQKELFEKNIHDGKSETLLPCHLAIEPA